MISRTETPTMEFVLAQCYLDDNDLQLWIIY